MIFIAFLCGLVAARSVPNRFRTTGVGNGPVFEKGEQRQPISHDGIESYRDSRGAPSPRCPARLAPVFTGAFTSPVGVLRSATPSLNPQVHRVSGQEPSILVLRTLHVHVATASMARHPGRAG